MSIKYPFAKANGNRLNFNHIISKYSQLVLVYKAHILMHISYNIENIHLNVHSLGDFQNLIVLIYKFKTKQHFIDCRAAILIIFTH